jgi:hypothetical protein
MSVEIGTEAAQFPEKEYINRIFFAMCSRWFATAPAGEELATSPAAEGLPHLLQWLPTSPAGEDLLQLQQEKGLLHLLQENGLL